MAGFSMGNLPDSGLVWASIKLAFMALVLGVLVRAAYGYGVRG